MRFANIIKTEVDESTSGVLVNEGDWNGTKENSDIHPGEIELNQQYGFASRPHDPDEEGCAEVLVTRTGSLVRGIATKDNRYTKAIGSLESGDTVMYAGVDKKSTAMIALKADGGRIVMYAPGDHDSDGEPTSAYLISMDPTGKAITIAHENGSSIILKDGAIQLSKGANVVSINDAGITIIGQVTIYGSMSVVGLADFNGVISRSGVPLPV